jgi:hypothetical protein
MANIRQQIIDAIEERMLTITEANNYSTTFKTVSVWRVREFEAHELPAMIIRDTSDDMPIESVGAGRRDHSLNVFLGIEFLGKTAEEQARETLADILAAIGVDETFGIENVAYCHVTGTTLIPDEASQRVAFGQVVLTIIYRSGEWAM